jgi:glucose/mannose-6-phosphate isomerase
VVRSELDRSDMQGAIAGMAAQLRAGDAIGLEAGAGLPVPDAVLITGMGGSAMGGELLRALVAAECPVPITRVRAFGIPSWVGPRTLVVCVSYSGGTDETLACARQAHAQGAAMLTVSSGGTLAELAQEWGAAAALVPGGLQPRAALGYLFGAMAGAFAAIGLAPAGIAEECAAGVEACDRAAALDLGARLAPTTPVVYGAGPLGAVAYRWKTQLNENAKMPAFSHAFPEAGHNEIVGWEGAEGRGQSIVVLHDAAELPEIRRRIDLTVGIMRPGAAFVEEVEGMGPTRASRAFGLVAHGDWASYGAALARGVDPTPVERISALKRAVAEASAEA